MLSDPVACSDLKLELALAMDMELIVTTTYTVEGDGLLVLLVHRLIEVTSPTDSTHTRVCMGIQCRSHIMSLFLCV